MPDPLARYQAARADYDAKMDELLDALQRYVDASRGHPKVCPECGGPADERVESGLKCAMCSYGND